MKRIAVLLMAVLLLLTGCTADPDTATPMEPTAPTAQPEEPAFAVYQSAHSVEVLTHGAVKRYALEDDGYYGLVSMGDGILLLSGEAETTLTRVSADGKVTDTTISGTIHLDQAAFWVTEQGVSYYNADGHNLVFLDNSLQETSRISLPEEMDTTPVLSEDWQRVYYYTADSLRCLELRTGISRLLKESSFQTQRVCKVCFEGAVLECYVSDGTQDRTLYISTETGETLFEAPGLHSLSVEAQYYFSSWREGDQELLLFGSRGETIQRLTPVQEGTCIPLIGSGYILSCKADSTGTGLTCYDLKEDTHISSIRLAGIGEPKGVVVDRDGMIWFLAGDLWSSEYALYCWDPSVNQQPVEAGYLSPYYTAESPDTEGLERCRQSAEALAEQYGIRIKIWEDAMDRSPEHYSLTPEHMVSAYDKYLPVLEKALSAFPREIYRKLGKQSKNGKLTISLVREVYGTNELGSQTLEQGVHYWDNGSSYLVLMMNDKLEQSVYHELFHAMDSYILTETKVYDDWRKLNPSGFAYDYSYITNEYRDPKNYLDPENRAFIDIYSMSYPKEDRARIMEYAMMEGNEAYFTSKTMSRKLETLCKGINRAFGLSDSEDFLWEQYL